MKLVATLSNGLHIHTQCLTTKLTKQYFYGWLKTMNRSLAALTIAASDLFTSLADHIYPSSGCLFAQFTILYHTHTYCTYVLCMFCSINAQILSNKVCTSCLCHCFIIYIYSMTWDNIRLDLAYTVPFTKTCSSLILHLTWITWLTQYKWEKKDCGKNIMYNFTR